jgi:hypothetical protein
MRPDLQGYAAQCTLGSLVPRLLGQCSLGGPVVFPPTRSYTGPSLLPARLSLQTLHLPLLFIDFPCGPLSLPSCPYILVARCFRLVAPSSATCSLWFLAHGFFYPEDGGDIFLRNVGSHKRYTAPQTRRRHSSLQWYLLSYAVV